MVAFGRKVELHVGEWVLRYPELYMEFEISFNTDSDGNTGHIRIFNLSENTINGLVRGVKFILKAGYVNDLGTLLPGVISSATTKWDGNDKYTELIISDNSTKWLSKSINRTWKSGSKSSDIVNDIIKELSMDIGEVNIPKEIIYPKGKTFACTCKRALEQMANDLKLKLHVSRNNIYLRPEGKGSTQVVLLNKNTGLISNPELVNEAKTKTETGSVKKYKIQSLLNHRIESDSLLKIESKTISGLWRVTKGVHTLSGEDFITEVEVVENGS